MDEHDALPRIFRVLLTTSDDVSISAHWPFRFDWRVLSARDGDSNYVGVIDALELVSVGPEGAVCVV
jgi:hypothetical protein